MTVAEERDFRAGTLIPQRSVLQKHVSEREFFIDNLLVRIHFIIVMIRWTGLAPWETSRSNTTEQCPSRRL